MGKQDAKTIIRIQRSVLLVLLALSLSLGLFIGRGAGIFSSWYGTNPEDLATDSGGEYRFIRTAPRNRPPGGSPAVRELRPFRYKVAALAERSIKAGEADVVSVYFRDLHTGHRFALNGQEPLSAGSLRKLPVMMAYLKWAESVPAILQRKLVYAGEGGGLSAGQTDGMLVKGGSYTVDALINRMIQQNDAAACALLLSGLPSEYIDRIFKDVYVNYDPTHQDEVLPFSAYSSFFRVLFNASYLNKDMSERSLRVLSGSRFRNGISAGLPSSIDCATRFDERTVQPSGEGVAVKQLYEFGIVYAPNRPFILGVMMRGGDGKKMEQVVRETASLIYDEVERQSR